MRSPFKWAKVVKETINLVTGKSSWDCPILGCDSTLQNASGLKCHVSTKHKNIYSYVHDRKQEGVEVFKITTPTPYLQGVFDACDEIEASRNEAKQRRNESREEQSGIAPVEMLEGLKVTDEMLANINSSEEFISCMNESNVQINTLLSLIHEEGGLHNLIEGIALSCVDVRSKILELAKDRTCDINTGKGGSNSGESRSEKSINTN